jgi:hypothetical protein
MVASSDGKLESGTVQDVVGSHGIELHISTQRGSTTAWGRSKSEHAGPKRGKGFWGRKAVAKATSRRARRRDDRAVVDAGRREGAR